MANKLWDDVKKSLQDLSNIATEKGKQFSKVAAEKAEEFTKAGKTRLELLQVNRDIEREMTELGGKVYHLKSEGTLETINDVTEIQAIFDKIGILEEKKAMLEKKLKEQKAREAQENAETSTESTDGSADEEASSEEPDTGEEK